MTQEKALVRRGRRQALGIDLRLRGMGLSVREIAATVVATDAKGALRRPSASLVARTLREIEGRAR